MKIQICRKQLEGMSILPWDQSEQTHFIITIYKILLDIFITLKCYFDLFYFLGGILSILLPLNNIQLREPPCMKEKSSVFELEPQNDS